MPHQPYTFNNRQIDKYFKIVFSGDADVVIELTNISNQPIDERDTLFLIERLETILDQNFDEKWLKEK